MSRIRLPIHLPTVLKIAREESRTNSGISPALALRLLGYLQVARDELVQLRVQLAEYREPSHAAWPPRPQDMDSSELAHLSHGVVLIDRHDAVWEKVGQDWIGTGVEVAGCSSLALRDPFRIIYDPAWPHPDARPETAPDTPSTTELRDWTAAELDALPPGTVLVTGLGEPWLSASQGWSSPTDVRSSAELAPRGPLRLLWAAPTLDPENADYPALAADMSGRLSDGE